MNQFYANINDEGILVVYAKTPLAAFALKTWAADRQLPEKMIVSWSPEKFHFPYVRAKEDLLTETLLKASK